MTAVFKIPEIESRASGYNPKDCLFSILIPSWNNLSLLKLCIDSIEKNSHFKHQIIVHVNESTDGTLEWVRQRGFDYTYSLQNAGVCASLNAAAKLVQTHYIVYLNDDMYVCPNWDFYLHEAIQQRTDDLFYYSATMIEHEFTKSKAIISPYNFGNLPENFQEQDLLEFIKNSLQTKDWNGACWPPSICSKRVWEAVGGYDENYSPGFYSDPDFGMKCWQLGIRDFKGIGKSLVYHFKSKSTQRVVRNNGRKLFAQKWGLPSSYFYNQMLKMGTVYKPHQSLKLTKNLAYWIARFKANFLIK